MKTNSIFKITRSRIVFLHDILMVAISFPLALYLRLGSDFNGYFPDWYIFNAICGFTLIAGVVLRTQNMYRGVWRYASLNDLVAIVRAVTITILIFLLALFLASGIDILPRSALFINWFVLTAMLGAPRFLYRIIKDHKYELKFEKNRLKIPVLLIGADNATDLFIRAMKRDLESSYRVVGIIADKRIGMRIQNVEVMDEIDELPSVIDKLSSKNQRPHKLILTDENLDGAMVRKLLDTAESYGLTLSRLPRPDALRSGSTDKIEVRPIDIEDLLQRPQRVLDNDGLLALIKGRSVMITGAGGSIGSELVRQISDFEPSHITLFENSEFNLYSIDMELGKRHSKLSKRAVIGDVRNRQRVNDIIKNEKPELVFHAAALKHVPMTEMNPIEGIMTNTIGTRIVADSCRKFGVKAMVMVSTDKAVNPTNVMGATKRMAECYCQALDISESANKGSATRYVTVRFGNVLGSTGSVVPLFQKQLADGEPLTVTHPDVERYFMTIREAVELILQASTLGSRKTKNQQEKELHGKIFVLEMGEPIKIADLAKQVIKLAGFIPEKDIKIKYTGLRPGEKLFEEIFHGAEPLLTTSMAGILLAEPRAVEYEALSCQLDKLEEHCLSNKKEKAFAILRELVPEYKKPENQE
ncbi:MAG: polysaccharide biosynthesis protein [Alphaproteobacteria bacterium]|nr:polysaccharide biosynthesis protein [Alphaproteobacteria bacterium]